MLNEQERQALRERAERAMKNNPERVAQVSRMLLEMAEHVHHLTQVSDEFLTNLALEDIWSKMGMLSKESDILSELMDRVKRRHEIAKFMALSCGAPDIPENWDEMWATKEEEIREREGLAAERSSE